MKVATVSDQVTGGEAAEPALTKIRAAMVARASMMNWASAMARFMNNSNPDLRPGPGQCPDPLDKGLPLA